MSPPRPAFQRRPPRRGISTLWLILTAPIFVLLLSGVVIVGNLWLARVELENALEAAALAAVQAWGRGPSGSTAPAREVGVAYAAANAIGCRSVEIDPNLDPSPSGDNPNENLLCCAVKPDPAQGIPPGGNLIFGAVTEEIPSSGEYVFNAGIRPSCGAGNVLFDASAQGSLDSGNHHEWGIAFQRDENTPDDVTIVELSIDLGADNEAFFHVADGLTLADLATPFKVSDGGTNEQPDIAGFPDPASQILWSFSGLAYGGTRAKVLTFTFAEDVPSGDLGFEPCDRFRFGLNVVRRSSSSQYDGDDIGDLGVTVTVTFSNGLQASGTFVNTRFQRQPCQYQGLDPYCGSIIVHPAGIPDLPCPPVPGQGNNPDGQSFGQLQGQGTRAFGVRAQAIVPVRGPICSLWGVRIGPKYVSAKATALYDCTTDRARLIRVETFICPGPNP
jgi:hypothetical protein